MKESESQFDNNVSVAVMILLGVTLSLMFCISLTILVSRWRDADAPTLPSSTTLSADQTPDAAVFDIVASNSVEPKTHHFAHWGSPRLPHLRADQNFL